MAFQKLLSFSKTVSDLADKPALTPTALKAQFDSSPNELKDAFNTLIDALKLTTSGDSGAKNIGATTISGLTGNDVQTILEGLKSYADTSFPLKTDTYNKTDIDKKMPATGFFDTFTIAAGATVDKEITYPPGKFTGRPNLDYSLSAGDIAPLYTLNHGIIANNKDSATIRFINKGSSAAYVIVYWQAKE
jgi:hypothetical protein